MAKKQIKSYLRDRMLYDLQHPGEGEFVHSLEVMGTNKFRITSRRTYDDNGSPPFEGDWESELNDYYNFSSPYRYHNFIISEPQEVSDSLANNDVLLKPSQGLIKKFNYYSEYIDYVSPLGEMDYLSYYFSYNSEVNAGYSDFYSVNMGLPLKDGFEEFGQLSNDYAVKDDTLKSFMRTIFFEDSVDFANLHRHKDDFPYYNELKLNLFPHTENSKFKDFINTSFQESSLLTKIALVFESGAPVGSFSVDGNTQLIESADVGEIFSMYNEAMAEKVILSPQAKFRPSMNNMEKTIIMADILGKFSNEGSNPQAAIADTLTKFEVLFIKVDKYIGGESVPTQSFYVPAKGINQLIDTQIALDKTYEYQISAYVLSYGMGYQYNIDNMTGDFTRFDNQYRGTWQTDIEVVYQPDLRIIKVDLGTIVGSNSEPLPAVPNISFVNTSNNTNFVKLMFQQSKNSSTGQYTPAMTDFAAAAGKETFNYSSVLYGVQLFRLTEKPTYYRNFNNSMMAQVYNESQADHMQFYDHIQPERKYYYMARSLNNSERFSNPSPVYEVYLTKGSGQSMINVRPIQMKKEKIKQKSKFFNKFLQLIPAENQIFFNQEDPMFANLESYEGIFDDIMVGGVDNQSLFGRKFKFRIRSKQTGRFIDFDVKFNLNKIKKLN